MQRLWIIRNMGAQMTCEEKLKTIRTLVDEQTEDEGLWTIPFGQLQPIMEAYLQQELRRLHALIEDLT